MRGVTTDAGCHAGESRATVTHVVHVLLSGCVASVRSIVQSAWRVAAAISDPQTLEAAPFEHVDLYRGHSSLQRSDASPAATRMARRGRLRLNASYTSPISIYRELRTLRHYMPASGWRRILSADLSIVESCWLTTRAERAWTRPSRMRLRVLIARCYRDIHQLRTKGDNAGLAQLAKAK